MTRVSCRAWIIALTTPESAPWGFHHINVDLLDTALDPLRPEGLVYVPTNGERMKLGAVECIVPAEQVGCGGEHHPARATGPAPYSQPESGRLRPPRLDLHGELNGVFEDWNPNVSCPVGL